MPARRRKAARSNKGDHISTHEPLIRTHISDPASRIRVTGNELFKVRNFQKALEAYSEGLSKFKNDHLLLCNRAAAYLALKNYAAALQDCNAVIKFEPTYAKAYHRKGQALEGQCIYFEARDAYDQGLAKCPSDSALIEARTTVQCVIDELELQIPKKKSRGTVGEEKSGDREEEKFDDMVSWLKTGGAQLPKLYLRYYSAGYRGVHLLEDVTDGEQILYVPKKFLMTSILANASTIGQKIKRSKVKLSSIHSLLASYVLQEMHDPQSFFRPYLNCLPDTYHTVPIFFTEKQKQTWLRGSFTIPFIENRIRSLRAEYQNLCDHISDYNKFTYDEFVWARLVVITRIFGINVDGQKTEALAPYADMLNHKMPRETHWQYHQDKKGFIIKSEKGLRRGDQVFDSYGRKCNRRFFVNYGFTLEENEDNEAVIPIALLESDPYFINKLYMLAGDRSKLVKIFAIPAHWGEGKLSKMLGYTRSVVATEHELQRKDNRTKAYGDEEIPPPLSFRNERATLDRLGISAMNALTKFDHTIEEDDKLLVSGELDNDINHRNSVVMRRGEKRVLKWVSELSRRSLELLDMNIVSFRQHAHAANTSSPLDRYIREVLLPLRSGQIS